MARVIFHVDMDAFYASIEQRDNPTYQGRPVIVGADPKGGHGRGVVAACSYEARRFGIHSALPISQAYRLCPDAVYLRPDMSRYVKVSREIRQTFRELTSKVEPISIDEAFLDVTDKISQGLDPYQAARDLKSHILNQHQLTASIGVAPNKFVAKIASDHDKPDGLVVIREKEVQAFLDPLPVCKIWGVGPRTEEKLHKLKIRTVLDLREFDNRLLLRHFGKHGKHLWQLANGLDSRKVTIARTTRSISQERTFPEDTKDSTLLHEVVEKLSVKISDKLASKQLAAGTVAIKIRYSDFTTFTRQASFRDLVWKGEELERITQNLLNRHWDRHRKIRLLGISVSSLKPLPSTGQLRLF